MTSAKIALSALTIALATNAATAAQIWWVDDGGGPGIDFLDIQPAIDVAGSGDVIVVHPGTYSGFTLGKDVTILGSEASNTSVVSGPVLISGMVGNKRAVLTGLRLETLNVLSNSAPVILDHLDVAPGAAGNSAVSIDACFDVRMYQCSVIAPSGTFVGTNGVEVSSSRLEVVDSSLRGSHGEDLFFCSDADHAGTGLWASNASILSVFQTSCLGGNGGNVNSFCEWTPGYGGDGGDGLFLRGGSLAVIAGEASDQLWGGMEGYGDDFGNPADGYAGTGLVLSGSSVAFYSGVTISDMSVAAGSAAIPSSPANPFLERFGTLQAGRLQTFWIHGDPGDQVTFYMGRSPVVVPDPLQEMDDLVTHERSYDLGPIPATGALKFEFTIPATFPIGFSFFAQAEVATVAGDRLTNSLPIVLRHLP